MHIALCGGRRGSYKVLVLVSSVFVWIDDGVFVQQALKVVY